MKKITYLFLSLLVIIAAGCKKNVITMAGDAVTGTQVKFVHVAPGTPALDVLINGTKVSPVATASVTDNSIPGSIITGIVYNNAFPVTLSASPNYISVPSGSTVIKIAASTPVPALVSTQTLSAGGTFGTATQNTADGSFYTAFAIGLPGSATTPTTVKVVEDKFVGTDATKAYVRLAYFIPNGAAVDMQGTYTPTNGTATTTTTTTNTTYGNVTDFVAVNVNTLSTSSYTFQLYLTGTTTKLGAVSSAIPIAPGKYYTIIGRGLAADYVVPGTGITLRSTARPTAATDPNSKLPEIYFNIPGLTFYTDK